jgi:hypothetical protein
MVTPKSASMGASMAQLANICNPFRTAAPRVQQTMTVETDCVSGRRGAKRSERSEDGTPEARDPPEGDRGGGVPRQHKLPRAGHAPEKSCGEPNHDNFLN